MQKMKPSTHRLSYSISPEWGETMDTESFMLLYLQLSQALCREQKLTLRDLSVFQLAHNGREELRMIQVKMKQSRRAKGCKTRGRLLVRCTFVATTSTLRLLYQRWYLTSLALTKLANTAIPIEASLLSNACNRTIRSNNNIVTISYLTIPEWHCLKNWTTHYQAKICSASLMTGLTKPAN